MAKTNGHATPNFLDEPLSGPEIVARVDKAIAATAMLLDELKTIRAGIHDLEGLDPAERIKRHDPVKAALLHFDEAHKRKFTDPDTQQPIGASIAWGKDNAIMKRVIAERGEEYTDRLIEEFFIAFDDDDYVRRMGWTVQVFAAKVPALIARMTMPVKTSGITRRTAGNHEQSVSAVRMIQNQYGNGTIR